MAAENASGPCEGCSTPGARSIPALMDSGLRASIEAAAEELAPGKHIRIPSGAGHDARSVSLIMPASMMFVPAIGGISHHWTEDTSDEDIALGAAVYVDAVRRMLEG